MKTFRYDYNNKTFIITLIISCILLCLTFMLFANRLVFTILSIMTIISFLNSFLLIRLQGITINKKGDAIIIVDQYFVRKFQLKDIRYVTIEKIEKKRGNKVYGFFCEYFYPHTYLSHCKFVYNQGEVFFICFHLQDGTIHKSYFGWLYKEKGNRVITVKQTMVKFIEQINILCKK